jgi:hypothetical protein
MAPMKRAEFAFGEKYVFIECPFCGKNLFKTDYSRIQKLLFETGNPRGKSCEHCGGIAVLTFSPEVEAVIRNKSNNSDKT